MRIGDPMEGVRVRWQVSQQREEVFGLRRSRDASEVASSAAMCRRSIIEVVRIQVRCSRSEVVVCKWWADERAFLIAM